MALPKLKAEGYSVTTNQPIARDDLNNNPDACCEICCNPKTRSHSQVGDTLCKI